MSDIRCRKMFAKSDDVHIEFKYREQPYIVWEPFGDNSRYWIGPKDSALSITEASVLENAFKRYRPSLHRAILGDVLTLQFIARIFNGKKSSS